MGELANKGESKYNSLIPNGNKRTLNDEGIKGKENSVLTPQITGHNLKNKLGLIKFGNYDKNTKKFYT